MKNQTKAIITAAALSAAAGLLTGQSAYADDQKISSKGNFVFTDGEGAAFYADDITYLQREIEELFNETGSAN